MNEKRKNAETVKKFLYTDKYKRSSRRAVLYGFDLLSVEGPLADETDEKIEKKDRLQAGNASKEWQINAFSDSLISQSLLLFRSSCVLLTKPESALRDLNDVFHYLFVVARDPEYQQNACKLL